MKILKFSTIMICIMAMIIALLWCGYKIGYNDGIFIKGNGYQMNLMLIINMWKTIYIFIFQII